MIPQGHSSLIKIFTKKTGRGINRFNMIREGDRILIGVSGGKDSLALSLALALRRKWVPVKYTLRALQIEWRELPNSDEENRRLDEYFQEIGISLKRIQACINPPSFRGIFNCYLCGRNKKRILFNEAENSGCNRIALGHNMDDFIETTLMNLFYHGSMATMMPVQDFFGGKIQVIRPLCEVKDSEIRKLAGRLGLPVIQARCERASVNQRVVMKEIIGKLYKINRHVRENIYKSVWNINREYLPSFKNFNP